MDLHRDFTMLVVDALPRDVRELLVEVGPKLMVAGGFPRDVMSAASPKDIDLFAVNKLDLEAAADLFDWTDQYSRKRTANAITFKNHAGGLDVQFVIRDFRLDHYNTLLSFDYTICQVGVYHDPDKGWVGIASEAFLVDFPNFEMHYTAPERDEDPGANVLRLLKFVSRGWKVGEADVAKVIGRFVSRLQDPTAYNFEGEREATERVKTAFRRVGYAGRPKQEEEVPF